MRTGKLGLLIGLAGVLCLGAYLRLGWTEDIEYKGDEAWTYQRVQEAKAGQPLSWLGMPSSQRILNPGLSVWVFAGLGWLFPCDNPPALARAVQIVNVVALAALVLFVLWAVPRGEREIWLWAAALVAVNPLAVLFHRKIWPPSVFPLLIVLFLWCWWYRQRWLGALGWGFVGALLGQIHIPGFFFAAGFVVWAVLCDCTLPGCEPNALVRGAAKRDRGRTAWLAWLLGSVLGSITLLPWLHYLAFDAVATPSEANRWMHLFEGKFWVRWVLEPIGFGLDYSLGRHMIDFLAQPIVLGQPTFGMLFLHLAAGTVGLVVVTRAIRHVWQDRARWWDHFSGHASATAACVAAALWGYGLLMTLSCFPIHRHYMIVLFPLQFVWLARLALGTSSTSAAPRGRLLLASLVVIQALLSLQFLAFVHDRQKIDGDYGATYASQIHPLDKTEVTEVALPNEP